MPKPRFIFKHSLTTGGRPPGGVLAPDPDPNGDETGVGEIKCVYSGPDYQTKWCPYSGSTPPTNPHWIDAIRSGDPVIVNNPKQRNAGWQRVMLTNNGSAGLLTYDIDVHVVTGKRSKVIITY